MFCFTFSTVSIRAFRAKQKDVYVGGVEMPDVKRQRRQGAG
jgi:hypothetical protein